MSTQESTHELVKRAYGSVAKQPSCCKPQSSCCSGAAIAKDHPVPEAELGLSCGDPVAFSHLKPGLAAIRSGGFWSVEVLSDQPVRVSRGCESRSARGGSATLDGAAASITILAVK